MSKRREKIERELFKRACGPDGPSGELLERAAADWIIKLQDALREAQEAADCSGPNCRLHSFLYTDPDYGLIEESEDEA